MSDHLEIGIGTEFLRPEVPRASWWAREIQLAPSTVLGAVIALAIFLRFALLGRNSLWFDEMFVYHITRMSWSDMLLHLRLEDAHPPLYYALMKEWTGLAGTSEIALRTPSACFSAASVWLTYLLARRLSSERVALLAAFIVAVSPFEIMAGQEARMYPLLGTLGLASTLLLLTAVERGGWGRWAAYVAVSAAMAYTHYLSALVIGAQGVWMLRGERRVFWQWFAAAAATLAVVLPWMPSLWYQATNGHVWAWYRNPATLSMLGDLLALYSFGGTLFGLGTYFAVGSRPPLEELTILLPFLLALWWGLRSPAFHGRAAALVGTVFVMPIGIMFIVSLREPMFYMRWFSFLGPFYAMLTAAGVLALADRFRGQRDRIVALMVVGLLAYSVPVLSRYYFDPNYRLYNWRAAAELVRARVSPGDLILYNGPAAKIAFTYYFRGHNDSLDLTPVEALPSGSRRATFDSAWVRRLSVRYPRVWVITTLPFSPQMQQRLQSDLETGYRLVRIDDFKAVWVTLIVAKDAARAQ
ncbi:MAG TPA: glycosyltransferase family 39 protein [bacterium]|nr:glycosyltransferase family 39 protein [bacterium]